MKKENNKKTEDFLEDFSFKPAPSILKGKILGYSRQRQKTNHVRVAFLWKGLVGCVLLLILVIAIDAAITHAQNKRFSSILQKEQESIEITGEERSLIKDVIGEFSDSTKSDASIKLYDFLGKKKNKRRQTEWREYWEKEIE